MDAAVRVGTLLFNVILPFRFLLLFLPVWSMARAEPGVALLQPGEVFTYRVGWGLIGNAGEIKISAQAETADGNQPRIRVTTTTSSRGVVRAFYPFDGDAWTLFDAQEGRLLSGAATTAASKKRTSASITFDYQRGVADYVDHVRSKRSAIVELPPGKPVDLITSLVQGRAWALAPGQSREALVLFDNEFYKLLITAQEEDTISSFRGRKKTIVLVPTMIGPPKGMFRKGGEVRVWVSDDEDRLPLRFEVKLKVGTAYAVLTDYQPPKSK